jgi:hypothetical protein
VRPAVLIHYKILKRCQKECAQATLLLIRTAQSVLLEQAREKTLDKILRISGGITAVAQKSVEWRPIGFAKGGERLPR